MNIEQLKLVLETLGQVGEGAMFITVLYLVLDHVIPLVGWLTTLFVILRLVRAIITAVSYEGHFIEIRGMLGVGGPGYITGKEIQAIKTKVRDLMEESNSKRSYK